MRHKARSSAIGWLRTALMLALLSGCAAAGSSTSGGSVPATAPDSGATAPSQPVSSAGTHRNSRKRAPSPLQTVEGYWRDIASHDFAAAYRDLAPGANPQGQAAFVSAAQPSQIQSAPFRG